MNKNAQGSRPRNQFDIQKRQAKGATVNEPDPLYRVLAKIAHKNDTHEELRKRARLLKMPVESFLWYRVCDDTKDYKKAHEAARKEVESGRATQTRIIKIAEVYKYVRGKKVA